MSGVVASTGSLAPFATVGAALRVRVVGPLGVELRGLAPIGTHRLSTATDGPRDLSVWLAGGGLVLAPRTAGAVRFELGAGALAAMRARRRRARSAPAMGSDDQAVGTRASTGAPAARSASAPRWAVRLDVIGGSTAHAAADRHVHQTA